MTLPLLDVVTYELKLPSTKQKVKYRPFLVKEHKVLMTLQDAESNEIGRIITDLVDVCTFNKLKMDELAHFDITYLFLNIRAKSISEIVPIIITCQNCETKFDSKLDLNKVEIENHEGHTNKIMINSSVGIELKYPKLDEVVKIYDSENLDSVFDMVTSSVKSVFTDTEYYDAKELTKNEITEFLNQLTKKQFDEIEKFFTTAPKVVQRVEEDCPNCNTKNIIKVEGLENFFV